MRSKKPTTFTMEFDKRIEQQKARKKKKQELFNKNIQKHIVYEDEYGNIVKKSEQPKKEEHSNVFLGLMTVMITLIILLLTK